MGPEEQNDLEFTENAWEALYDAVDSTYFREQDADLIYHTLQSRLRPISFGEYLRRYIYQKAELTEPFDSVPVKTYQNIIQGAFSDNHTPQSFTPTTSKLSALAKNWLTQQSVKREVVFLLGFGLSMSLEDVSLFLTKALREQGINAKDPFEVICWYCFKNGYGYLKFEKLWQVYQETPVDSLNMGLLYSEETIGARNAMYTIHDDAGLFAFLSRLKTEDNRTKAGVTARRHFNALYDEARDLIADMYNMTAEEDLSGELIEYQRRLSDNDRLYDYEKQQLLEKRRGAKKQFSLEDITESDIEHVICSAIPVDRHGNLTPGKASALNSQFAGKRFSRQHIHDILTGKADISRFDLITLNFFVYSQKAEDFSSAEQRYGSFIDSTNNILGECFLGPLYIANPYECFVLMCILSDDPLGTYADVWEMSYGSD